MWDHTERLQHFDSIDPNLKGYVLASLFRPAFVRALISNRHRGILHEMGLMALAHAGATISELYEWAYQRMHQRYRCEYVFKNEVVLRELLPARHNPAIAAVASEFPLGNNRLDLLVINGTSVAYEIKTKYDHLERLPVQTSVYSFAFERVNVVCDPSL